MPVSARKVWVQDLQMDHNMSIVMSFEITDLRRTAFYYEPKLKDDRGIIEAPDWVTERHPR